MIQLNTRELDRRLLGIKGAGAPLSRTKYISEVYEKYESLQYKDSFGKAFGHPLTVGSIMNRCNALLAAQGAQHA